MEERKKRKPNWSNDECLCLANFIAEYKDILRGKLGPDLTSGKKKATWKLVTDRLNASFTAVNRTQEEVEKKWHNIFSQAKAEITAYKKEQSTTGGGPASKPLSAIAEVVMSILGEDNVCLGGIAGGIDSTLLQILQSHPIDVPCMLPAIAPETSLIPLPSTSQAVDITTYAPAAPPPAIPAPAVQSKDDIIKDLKIKKLKLQIAYYEMKLKQNQEE